MFFVVSFPIFVGVFYFCTFGVFLSDIFPADFLVDVSVLYNCFIFLFLLKTSCLIMPVTAPFFRPQPLGPAGLSLLVEGQGSVAACSLCPEQ